jgi:hypothetical protein
MLSLAVRLDKARESLVWTIVLVLMTQLGLVHLGALVSTVVYGALLARPFQADMHARLGLRLPLIGSGARSPSGLPSPARVQALLGLARRLATGAEKARGRYGLSYLCAMR